MIMHIMNIIGDTLPPLLLRSADRVHGLTEQSRARAAASSSHLGNVQQEAEEHMKADKQDAESEAALRPVERQVGLGKRTICSCANLHQDGGNPKQNVELASNLP